ncbi:MAG: TerC family protein [Cyanobium sp.]
MVPSLSPLLQGADQWGEVLLLLPLLVALEAVLSADNAIALAAISRRLHDPVRQRQALNLGLLMALVLRLGLIAAARWVLDAWPLQLLAAGYLLWLCGRHLLGLDEGDDDGGATGEPATSSEAGEVLTTGSMAAGTPVHPSHGKGPSLGSIALTLALTDLAFSLDSVAAAVAVTDRLILVMAGGVLGVLALRLTAGLFVRWLEVFPRLETAGYLAVGLVGIRLLLRLLQPDLEIPEWALLLLVASLFAWGFSGRNGQEASPDPLEQPQVPDDTPWDRGEGSAADSQAGDAPEGAAGEQVVEDDRAAMERRR